jgi:hypothetical protein
MPNLPGPLSKLAGKTRSVPITEHLGEIWAHEPEGEATIRFYDDADFLYSTIVEFYEDYLNEQDGFLEDGEWVHPTIVPFASVGGDPESDDESFFSESFAFLFWDTERSIIVSTTTDDWSFTELGDPDALGL